jgi:hypothetical protein
LKVGLEWPEGLQWISDKMGMRISNLLVWGSVAPHGARWTETNGWSQCVLWVHTLREP